VCELLRISFACSFLAAFNFFSSVCISFSFRSYVSFTFFVFSVVAVLLVSTLPGKNTKHSVVFFLLLFYLLFLYYASVTNPLRASYRVYFILKMHDTMMPVWLLSDISIQ